MNTVIDLHTHTDNSEDSKSSMDSMVCSAVNKGIAIIAFTEHVDFNPEDEGYLYFNETRYSQEIRYHQYKYNDQIKILKGLEFGEPHLYSEFFHDMAKNDYDVILGSVHMIDDKFVGDKSILKRYSLEGLYTKYYEIMLDMVRYGGFDVLAHFDFPKRYYQQSFPCRDLTDEILTTIIKNGIALEINTSPLRKGYHEASPDKTILSRYARLGGVKVTIGSDAHNPEDLGADYEYAIKLIESEKSLEMGYFQERQFTKL